MKKTYILLVVFLYLFMVVLRIVGQYFNGFWQPGVQINWKATLTLGELDNTQDYGPRWYVRIATLLIFPLVWIKVLERQVKKVI